jgi:hypothetical protein
MCQIWGCRNLFRDVVFYMASPEELRQLEKDLLGQFCSWWLFVRYVGKRCIWMEFNLNMYKNLLWISTKLVLKDEIPRVCMELSWPMNGSQKFCGIGGSGITPFWVDFFQFIKLTIFPKQSCFRAFCPCHLGFGKLHFPGEVCDHNRW